MESAYIKAKKKNISDIMDLKGLLYGICKISCIMLIIYFCWYVEAFGNLGIVVYGSFLVMSGCIAAIWILENEIRFHEIPFGIWNMFIIAVYCYITGIFVAYNTSTLLYAVRQYFIYSIVAYAFCFVSAYYKSFTWILAAINAAVMICCIHLIFFGYHYTENRIVLSANSNPNILGTILNLGLFSILYRSEFKLKSLLVVVPQVALLVYNIVMTGSRKSFLVAAGLLLIWGFSMMVYVIRNGSRKTMLLFFILVIIAAIAFGFFFFHFVINTELFSRMKTMGNEESNSMRVKMYIEGWRIFTEKPIFGGGLDQYLYWSGIGLYSHSTYAEAISSFGFIGTVLYFSPFIYTAVRACKYAFGPAGNFQSKFVLGFCFIEFFLAAGQIWFYDISHIIAWTLIFLVIRSIGDANSTEKTELDFRKRCKYVKC